MSHQTARSGPCGLKDGHGGDHRTPQGVEAVNARNASPEGKARKARYNARYDASPEGKARKARYDASPKGKARDARYNASPRGCHTARVWGMRYNNRSRRAALEVRYEEERLEIRERLQPVDSRGVRDAGLEGQQRPTGATVRVAHRERPQRRGLRGVGGQQPRACSDLHDGRGCEDRGQADIVRPEAPQVKEAEYDLLCNLGQLLAAQPQRVLDFDIENRPLSYWYDGHCTAEITAIAASFGPREGIKVWLLGIDEPVEILERFRALYDEADVVTGHYIRKHDLPIINGAMLEHGFGPLGPKLTSDTRLDLVRFGDLPASQEALAAMLGVKAPKTGMSQADWRAANRLGPAGIALTKIRVVSDVRQHMAMRAELLKRGWLYPPRRWRP